MTARFQLEIDNDCRIFTNRSDSEMKQLASELIELMEEAKERGVHPKLRLSNYDSTEAFWYHKQVFHGTKTWKPKRTTDSMIETVSKTLTSMMKASGTVIVNFFVKHKT
jgi:hypothetical protein